MLDSLIKYSKWIYIGCLSINVLLGLYLFNIAPTDGTNAPWVFLVIFTTVSEMVTLQVVVAIVGLFCLKYKKATIALLMLNLAILIISLNRYF